MHTRYNIHESIDDYLQSINGKTAELFWLACLEGAHFGGLDTENQERAGEIGRNIGIAFQVFDDILDYTSDSGTLKTDSRRFGTRSLYLTAAICQRTGTCSIRSLFE